MEGISRALGVGPHIEFDGNRPRVQGRILRHLAEIESQMLHGRVDPIAMTNAVARAYSHDSEIGKEVVKEAFRQAKAWGQPSYEEITTWLQTWRGRCFSVYLALRENNPAVYTLDYVTQVICDKFEEQQRSGTPHEAVKWLSEILKAIAQAGGEDDSGNSTGGRPSQETTAEKR